MDNPFSLTGKTVLVTGASSGIGRSTAIECSKMGATVVVTGRNAERLDETFRVLEGSGHQKIVADLSDLSQIDSFVGRLPILNGVVHGAGINILKPVKAIKTEVFTELMNVNFYAPVFITQQILAQKKIERSASVVLISSVGRTFVANGSAMYASSKGALSSFAKVLALELAPRAIRVNCIEPGVVETGIFDSGVVSNEQLAQDMRTYPLGRFGRPEEIAYAAVYLLSDASNWTTGSNLVIDGGLTLK